MRRPFSRSDFLWWVAGAAALTSTLLSPALGAEVPAPAEAAPAKAPVPIDFAFGARIQSDYNFRGISQSNHKPSPQAYGELQLFDNFLYFGVNYYRVDLPTKPQAEIDLTGGIRPKSGDVTFDLGYIYYYYPGERRLFDPTFTTFFTPKNTDFLELAAKASWAINDQWTVGAGVFHAWDWLGSGAPGTYRQHREVDHSGVLPGACPQASPSRASSATTAWDAQAHGSERSR